MRLQLSDMQKGRAPSSGETMRPARCLPRHSRPTELELYYPNSVATRSESNHEEVKQVQPESGEHRRPSKVRLQTNTKLKAKEMNGSLSRPGAPQRGPHWRRKDKAGTGGCRKPDAAAGSQRQPQPLNNCSRLDRGRVAPTRRNRNVARQSRRERASSQRGLTLVCLATTASESWPQSSVLAAKPRNGHRQT